MASPIIDRDAKDIAIEFGCYLASAAERYLDYINSPKPDDDRLSEDYRALRSAIYEFRKRATRAG